MTTALTPVLPRTPADAVWDARTAPEHAQRSRLVAARLAILLNRVVVNVFLDCDDFASWVSAHPLGTDHDAHSWASYFLRAAKKERSRRNAAEARRLAGAKGRAKIAANRRTRAAA